MCSERANWYTWSYILRILLLRWGLHIVHGLGSPSDLMLSSWEIAALRVVASCGGRGSQSVLRVFLNREDVHLFCLCGKAALL